MLDIAARNNKKQVVLGLDANLVKDGNYGMPYLPEKLYADLRRLTMFRDQNQKCQSSA